ncbi:MAG: hypothetical protein DKM50_13490 [Candidatus Margulisiibacteriota bacterium]|nr:MAG: hypothetical protein A2X43_10640 [Candidatus Margulisbacteria bacterium GWD2_39_127]OGI04462.1 MAG: hypothetical protein A2X42_04125 [Candidatus Margulisbacteria bacterium GWF2_38_17]OGI07172.1 MAG: hypothetical protein A2X41_06195 [Candidatus Margulisbacteria bacterium GWE2_39_32]PZM77263.1 MAG: hypothetical protein DKM50_13490 [Candidatus Margulisiibacteriota bacterium]HAR64387.1 hypothetical protein [Candidatus Margulisiibacteriota bacterium]
MSEKNINSRGKKSTQELSERLQTCLEEAVKSEQKLSELKQENSALRETIFKLEENISEYKRTGNVFYNKSQDHLTEELEQRVKDRTFQLEKEKALLNAVIGQMPVGVIIVEAPSGKMDYWNTEIEKIWKQPTSPLSRIEEYKKFKAFRPDGRRYLPEEWPLSRSIRSGEIVRDEEIVIEREDGSYGTLLISSAPIRDSEGNITEGLAVDIDITERKALENEKQKIYEELQKHVAELNATLNSIADGIIISDIDGNIVTFNKKAKNIFGNPQIGEPLRISQLDVAREDGTKLEDEDAPALHALRGEPIIGMVLSIKPPGSDSIWVNLTAASIKSADTTTIGVVSVFTDITHLKTIENQCRVLSATLEKSVLERTEQIEATNRELESLTYSITHDLYSPLRSIDGFNSLLSEKIKINQCDPEGISYIERSHVSIQKIEFMVDTIRNILSLLKDVPTREEVNLSSIVSEVVDRIKITAGSRTGEITVEPDVTAFADKRFVTIIIEHLIDNAFKFTKDKPQFNIEFGAITKDNKTIYYIKDNGIGFKNEYSDKLFRPFYRLQGALSESDGYGTGLAIVHAIVKKHIGEIWAEGEEGKGAIFYFTLGQ